MIDGWMIDDWWVDRAKLSRGILESCKKKLYSEESVCSGGLIERCDAKKKLDTSEEIEPGQKYVDTGTAFTELTCC